MKLKGKLFNLFTEGASGVMLVEGTTVNGGVKYQSNYNINHLQTHYFNPL